MSTKNWIRTIVAAGLLAWPGVETYRYFVARHVLETALQQQDRVAQRLAQVQQAQAVKERNSTPLIPASHPAATPPKTSSNL